MLEGAPTNGLHRADDRVREQRRGFDLLGGIRIGVHRRQVVVVAGREACNNRHRGKRRPKEIRPHHYMNSVRRQEAHGVTLIWKPMLRVEGSWPISSPCWLPALYAVSGSMFGAFACVHRLRPTSATFMR